MLSASKYPYMNRAYRRNPNSYAAGLGAVALAGSALLLALLRRAGFMFMPAYEQRPNPLLTAIRKRGKSIVTGIKGMLKKLFS